VSIRKRGKKSWEITIPLGLDRSTGKRLRDFQNLKGSKREAEAEERRLLRERDTGTYALPGTATVGAYLKRYLAFLQPNIRPRTFESYEAITRVHLEPTLGPILLNKLRPLHLQNYYAEKLNGHSGTGSHLSALSILHHHRLLHAALAQAVRWQVIAVNPAVAASPPRVEARIPKALDEKQTAEFIGAVKKTGSILYMPILLAAATGLRRGELLGLTWANVDLRGRTIAVTQTLQKTAAGLVFQEPKTALSRREISLPAFAVEALRQHRKEQLHLKMLLGSAYVDHNLVCCREDGRPWVPGRFSAAFGALAKRVGIPGLRFHDLRHGHCSQLLRRGIDVQSTSTRLGHSTASTTLRLYAHTLRGADQAIALSIDKVLGTAIQREVRSRASGGRQNVGK
jgi:integrase